MKPGDSVRVRDADGGSTRAKIVSVSESWVVVRWLEARWNLRENLLVSRKGTTSTVSKASVLP